MKMRLALMVSCTLMLAKAQAASLSGNTALIPCIAVTISPLASVLNNLSQEQADGLYTKITQRVCARLTNLMNSGNEAVAAELLMGLVEAN